MHHNNSQNWQHTHTQKKQNKTRVVFPMNGMPYLQYVVNSVLQRSNVPSKCPYNRKSNETVWVCTYAEGWFENPKGFWRMPLRNSTLAAIPRDWNGRKESRKRGTKSYGSTCDKAQPRLHYLCGDWVCKKPTTELFLGSISKFFTQSSICSNMLMNWEIKVAS